MGWLDDLISRASQTGADSEAHATYLRFRDYPGRPADTTEFALSSGSNLVIVPMQDILGLGAEARMNTPATTEGNWNWRVQANALSNDLAATLRRQIAAANRFPES